VNKEDLLNENFNLKNKINEIQNQFQAIFEQTSDGIFIANSEGTYIDVNQAGCAILGYSKEEILGKKLKDLLTKEKIDIKPIKYDQLGSSKTSISIKKLLHKSGKIIYVEVSDKKLDNGNLIQIIKDITDYDILSKKLKASEEIFSRIFKLTPNALSIISMGNGKVLEVNDEALKMSGYSREELLSTPNLQENLWAEHSEKDRLILKLSKEGYLKNEEVLVKSKDNKLYNCLLSSEFIELDNKMYVLNLLNDFTKQKQIQEKLNNERKNLKTLIETLPDLVWVKDINGVYLSCNNKFEKFIGHKESEIIGKTDYDFVERDLAEFFRENDKKALENNKPTTNLEWLTFASDGHKELVQTIKTPLYDYSNNLVGVLGIARNITDLYEAQEKLIEREEIYSAIVNNASDSIVLIDPENGNILEFNEATYKTLGYTKEEFKGINIIDINAINPQNEILDIHTKVINENMSKTFETKHRCKNGSLIDVRISMKNIKLKNKDYIVSIGSDITERKQKEKELLELTNSLKNAQALAKIGSWDLDLKTNKLKSSDEMFNIFEVNKSDFNGNFNLYLNLVHPEDLSYLSKIYNESIINKKPYDVTHRLLMKDGRIKYVNEKCITECNEEGEPIRSFGTTQDITDKKLIELQLQDAQEKYKLIAENVDDVIWILDPIKMKFNYVSHSVKKLRGYTSEEVCKQSMEEVITPESYKKLSEILPKRIKSFYKGELDINSSEITEIYQPTKSGEVVATEVITKFILDKNTNLIQILGVSRNITERKKIEDKIKELNQNLEEKVKERTQLLEQANKDLEAFAYSVSHDLRAPLRHIDGFTNLLKAKLPMHNEESDKYIKKITSSSKKMSLMIDELLKFSRLGRKTLDKSNISLNTIINQVIEQYKPDYYNRKINFEIEKLPEVLGDHILLQSVFQNIISNAIKFTSKKEEAFIKIGLIKKDNKKIIYIKDNGAGFDMAYSGKLFGVFQRLHSENDFSGTGIGLANVKQIITKHGWTIHAEAEIDKGATFFITLEI
jgi:PAS domain S-box-containing protein